MGEFSDFTDKATKQTVYWKNTFTNDDAVFRSDPDGHTYTRLKGGKEFQSDNSTLAFDAKYYDLHEITKEEYDKF